MKNSTQTLSARALTFVVALILAASPAAADFVINDDLIVDGSACIGFDCVNGEVFSFDTIRLKENNLRIKFDDTSVAASFPRNDWQLTANDSANGGASKFSIDDISGGRTPFTVEANAPNHSLYVDDGGRIGNGTSTPSVEFHIVDGDTPTLRLQQDGSSGFAPQTWDVAGNETSFFIRDASNGSTLPFRIRPGAPSSAVDIAATGNVGIGTASPANRLHVRQSAAGTVALLDTGSAANSALTLRSNTNTDWTFSAGAAAFNVSLLGSGVTEMSLTTGGNMTIPGTLNINGGVGGGCTGCDGVFDPTYEVGSIEEHAEFMWRNSYLPAIGPTPDGEKVSLDIAKRHFGVLNELEKAHIYIERLNERLKDKESRLDTLSENLEQKNSQISELTARLSRLESLLLNEDAQRNDD